MIITIAVFILLTFVLLSIWCYRLTRQVRQLRRSLAKATLRSACDCRCHHAGGDEKIIQDIAQYLRDIGKERLW